MVGNNVGVLITVRKGLSINFDMKNMGEANVILGVKIIRCNSGLMLTKKHYVKRLLKKFGHFDVQVMSTPYDANTHLIKNKGDSIT